MSGLTGACPLLSLGADVGATVGDKLTLQIGSEKMIAQIASIRKVDWQSMRPNFYMVFPRRVLEALEEQSVHS